jgi:aspartyl-tRNA(Asn)/glutamyl-tRNA(Gln) amidotransferase subunit A
VKNREVSAEEAVRVHLARIETTEEAYSAFITVSEELALEHARCIDRRLAVGEDPPLLPGVPVAYKDNLCTTGLRTTCASRILESFTPPYTATVVENLEQAGAITVGKTNMDEFAMGSSCENSAFHPTRNPWDTECVPGGSSGGSAAAVAGGQVPIALGSDTGGSVRQPASFCGVVGIKPTYGRVSRYGLVAFASSLDQIGPITRTVEEGAVLLSVISGSDPNDSTSVDVPVPDYTAGLDEGVEGLRIGVPTEYVSEGIEPEVRSALENMTAALEDEGARVEECSLPHTEYALSVYYLIAPAEASSNLARYDGVRYGFRADSDEDDLETMYRQTRGRGFGPEVRRRIMLGTYALSAGYYDAYYLKALKVRRLVKRDFDEAFENYDLLLTPTSPSTAFELGAKTDDPLAMYLSDICTIPVNLAGLPAVSVPGGFAQGKPIGLQLIAPHFKESVMLRAAAVVERCAPTREFPDLSDEEAPDNA